MRVARRVWSGLCLAIVLVAFFRLPAWDTAHDPTGFPYGEEWFSGAEEFAGVAVLVALVWLVGLGVLALVDEILQRGRGIEPDEQ